MFGFGEKAKLEKLANGLRGCNLSEAISNLAEAHFTQKPKLQFDLSTCNEISTRANIQGNLTQDEKADRIRKALGELALPSEAAELFFAKEKYSAVMQAAEALRASTAIGFSRSEWMNYFFDTFIREVGLENIFFFLFPQRSSDAFEDLWISKQQRDDIMTLFIKHIGSRKNLITMANHFAAMNPYFRDYPIK